MPEGLEAEIWRTAIARLIGRVITDAWSDERVSPSGLRGVLAGAEIVGVRRHGKVVVLDVGRCTVGLHFGMTGRVVVDGRAPIERLTYASNRDRAEWDRLRIWTGDAEPALRVNDPRRLGRTSLDPDLTRLGADALTLSAAELRSAVEGRRAAVKTTLLDQAVVAGLGNLCADEVLFWASISPERPVDGLDRAELTTLAATIRRRLAIMLRRGGSTTGTLDPARRSGPGRCPRDGAQLERRTLGGRTAVWCPLHQR